MNQQVEYDKNVIIGWGMAGATLAWQLYFRNESFCVYDSTENHSTRAAAGLVNPVVFRRLTKSWNADTLVPYAEKFYAKIEKTLGLKLMSYNPIWRVFASIEEQNNWCSKMGDDRFRNYLKLVPDVKLPAQNEIDAPFGIGEVVTLGNVSTNLFLDASKAFFLSENKQFINASFEYGQIDDSARFFFCEGTGMFKNPLFKDLPLKGTHGETLTIETTSFKHQETLNKNMFLMYLSDGKYKVGATYNWELKEPVITQEAREDLVERLESFTDFDYKIVKQEAGIRPTVKDRRPLIGAHAEQKNAFILNGLGTKGVMIAPYYANQLIESVFDGQPIDSEVNIVRFSGSNE